MEKAEMNHTEEDQNIYPELVNAQMILDNEQFAKQAAEMDELSLEEIKERALVYINEFKKQNNDKKTLFN